MMELPGMWDGSDLIGGKADTEDAQRERGMIVSLEEDAPFIPSGEPTIDIHFWEVQNWPLEVLQRESDRFAEHEWRRRLYVHFHSQGTDCVPQCFNRSRDEVQSAKS